MKVAITGANGFLGSYLVKECLSQRMEVYALIRAGANTSLLPTHEHLHVLTVNYQEDLSHFLDSAKTNVGSVDYFLHNAGMTVSLNEGEYYEVNVELTRRISESVKSTGFLSPEGIFGYISSYAAHGPAETGKPVSHYGESKLQAEEVIKHTFNKYLIARPTAIYGAGDTAFLPLFKSAKAGIYPVTNSAQRMTMIHAQDLASMIVSDIQSHSGTLHYCDGSTYLHKDFIQVFELLFTKKIKAMPLPAWLARLSMGASDLWHKAINKRPGITLEKFSEISQHWDLHTTDLPHSQVRATISLEKGFRDALNFYHENKLL